jgi:hypothetical protein
VKEEEMRNAKANFRAAIAKKEFKPVQIKLGLDSNVLAEIKKLDVV